MPNILETITIPIKLSKASPEIVFAVQECLGIKADGICDVETILTFYGLKKRHNLNNPDYLDSVSVRKLMVARF